MAQPPLNTPRRPNPQSGVSEEKKSKTIPIVIGIIVLAIVAYFIINMMGSDDEVITDDTATTSQTVPDPAVSTTPTPVVEPSPADTATPEPATEPASAVPAIQGTATPTDAGVTEESVTVDIVEPDADAPAVAEDANTETTTVPLQAPAN